MAGEDMGFKQEASQSFMGKSFVWLVVTGTMEF